MGKVDEVFADFRSGDLVVASNEMLGIPTWDKETISRNSFFTGRLMPNDVGLFLCHGTGMETQRVMILFKLRAVWAYVGDLARV